MSKTKKNNQEEAAKQTSSKEEGDATPELSNAQLQKLVLENNQKIKEVYRIVKHIRTMHTIKFVVTIIFIILPILGAYFIVPRIINTATSTFAATMGGDTTANFENKNIFEIFQELLGSQSAQIQEMTNSK